MNSLLDSSKIFSFFTFFPQKVFGFVPATFGASKPFHLLSSQIFGSATLPETPPSPLAMTYKSSNLRCWQTPTLPATKIAPFALIVFIDLWNQQKEKCCRLLSTTNSKKEMLIPIFLHHTTRPCTILIGLSCSAKHFMSSGLVVSGAPVGCLDDPEWGGSEGKKIGLVCSNQNLDSGWLKNYMKIFKDKLAQSEKKMLRCSTKSHMNGPHSTGCRHPKPGSK